MSQEAFGGRVAIVGTGHRSRLYVRAVAARPASTIVALCDTNSVRMKYVNDLLQSLGEPAAKEYSIVSLDVDSKESGRLKSKRS